MRVTAPSSLGQKQAAVQSFESQLGKGQFARKVVKVVGVSDIKDGARVIFEDGSFALFRYSGTEDRFTLKFEAPTPARLTQLMQETAAYLKTLPQAGQIGISGLDSAIKALAARSEMRMNRDQALKRSEERDYLEKDAAEMLLRPYEGKDQWVVLEVWNAESDAKFKTVGESAVIVAKVDRIYRQTPDERINSEAKTFKTGSLWVKFTSRDEIFSDKPATRAAVKYQMGRPGHLAFMMPGTDDGPYAGLRIYNVRPLPAGVTPEQIESGEVKLPEDTPEAFGHRLGRAAIAYLLGSSSPQDLERRKAIGVLMDMKTDEAVALLDAELKKKRPSRETDLLQSAHQLIVTRSEMRQDPNETLEALEKQLSGKTFAADGLQFKRRSTGTHPVLTLLIGKTEGTAELYEISFSPNAPGEFTPNEGWNLSVYSSTAENLGNTRKWSYRLTEKTPSIRPGMGEVFEFRFPEEEYAFLDTVKGIEIVNNRLQITVSRDFWDGLQTSPVRDGEGNFMVRKVAEHGILVPAARRDIPSVDAARREFLKGFKPYYQFLSEGDDFSVEKPHVFHVLGNPDAMTFIRFAQAWKSEYAGTPVVLAGGRGRGTVPLIENILAYYGDRLEASDREKLEGGRTDANVKETDLIRLIFKLEGFTDGDFEKVFDEKQPSKNTEQNFEFSQEKIDELTAGVTNPVIAEVSRPDLLRRVQAQGKKSLAAIIEAKGWQVRRFKVYTEDLDRMPDQDLLRIAAYTAGHPDDYVLKHKTLPSWFDQNELRGYQFLIGIGKKDRDYSTIQNFLPAYSLYLDALGAVPDDSGTQLMVRSEMRPQPLDERFEMERAGVEASLTAVRDRARLERNRDVMDLMQRHLDTIAREPNAGSLIAAKEEIAKHLDILARVKRSEVRKVPANTIVTESSTQPWYDIQNLQETLRAERAHVKSITVFGKKLNIGKKETNVVVGQFYNLIRANAPRGKAHNGFLFRAEWEWSEALGGLTLKVLPLPVPMPYALKSVQDLLTVNYTEIDRIIEAFMADMDKGLAGQPSSLSMIPAYVQPPTGKEEGEFMALDLGGTNFRVLTLKLQGGEYSKPVIQRFRMKDKKIYTTTGDALFDFIAESVAQFMKAKRIPADRKIRLGFTFSFAVNQTGMASGKLDRWSKEFKATGVIGQDVVELLNNAFTRRGIKNVEISALVNDTVGTLATATFEDSNTTLGVILGTGTNAAVWMRIADIRKWRGEQKAGLMAVNMEWGNFNKLKITRFDKRLHQAFGAKPGEVRKQTLEKMVSGKYLGEVFRQVLIELIPGGKLFEGTSAVPAKISKVESLETAWMSRIAADRSSGLTGVAAVLKKMGIEKSTLEERRTVQQIASWVAARSARISAAVIAASLIKVDPQGKNLSREHTVAVDGSVYEFYPGYQEEIRRVFNVVFGPETARKIKLVLTRDGSGVGAAVIAASAGKSSRSEMRNVITLEPITLQGPVSLFDLMRARIPELADATRPDDVAQFWKAHDLKATIEFTSSRIPLQPSDLKGSIGAKGGIIRIQYTLVRSYETEDAAIIKTGVGTELARSLQKFLATPQPRARLAAETVVAREITEAQPAGPDELAQLLKRVSLDVVYRRDKASVEAGKDGLAFRINRMTSSGMSMIGQPGFSKGVKGAVSTDLEVRRKQFLLLLFSELLGQDFDLDKKLAEDTDEVVELKIGVNEEIASIYKRSEQRETPQLSDSALLARLYTSTSAFKAAENAIAARLKTEGRDLPSVLAVSQAVTQRWVGVTELLIPGFIPYAQITFGLAPAGFNPGFVSPAQSNEVRSRFSNAGTSADNESRVSAEAPIAPRTVVLVGDTGMTEQDLAAMQLPRGSRIIVVDQLGGDSGLWNRYSKLRIGNIRARRFSAKGDMPSEQELRSIFGSRDQVPVLVLGKNSAEGVLDAYKDTVLHEGFVTTLPESHEARFALSYFLGHGTPELLRKQIPDDLLTIRLRSNALSPTSIPLSAQGRFADWAFAEIKRRTFESAA